MNAAQVYAMREAGALPAAARSECARIASSMPVDMLKAAGVRPWWTGGNGDRQLPAEDPRKGSKVRSRTPHVLDREKKTMAKVLRVLRVRPGEKLTFVEIASRCGIQRNKIMRRFVFFLGEEGVINTDLKPYGRRFWLNEGE